MMRWMTLGLVVVASSACLTDRIRDRARDRDRDGHQAWAFDGTDCDDEDAAVNPDQPEVCGNGKDDNCDGIVDDDGEGGLSWYPDADGDGFPGSNRVTGCVLPAASFPNLDLGVDCDDGDAAVNPDVTEIWYDGVDQNCDGNDADADNDGFDAVSAGGTDCDDANDAVNPESIEICNNGWDDNCDGGVGRECGLPVDGGIDALRILRIPSQIVRGIADQDGDGAVDILVSDLTSTRLFRGPFGDGVIPAGSSDITIHNPAGWGCVMGQLDSGAALDFLCPDPTEERVAWLPMEGVQSQDYELSMLDDYISGPGPLYDGQNFGFDVRVVSGASWMHTRVFLWVLSPYVVETSPSIVAISDGWHVYQANSPRPVPANYGLDFGWDLGSEVAWVSGDSSFYALDEAGQHVVGVMTSSSGATSLVWSIGATGEPQSYEALMALPLGGINWSGRPRDIDGDGFLDLVVVGSRGADVGGAVTSAIFVLEGPFESRGDLPLGWEGGERIVTAGLSATESYVSAEFCDIDADGVPEIAASYLDTSGERFRVDVHVYRLSDLSAPISVLRDVGLVVGCADFDQNGADDIVTAHVGASVVSVIYGDVE